MALTKNDIVDLIFRELHFPKHRSVEVVESLLEIIKRTLASGEDVLITGFGKFSVREKSERRGRNPQTGDDLTLKARRVVTFKCSTVLKDKVNR